MSLSVCLQERAVCLHSHQFGFQFVQMHVDKEPRNTLQIHEKRNETETLSKSRQGWRQRGRRTEGRENMPVPDPLTYPHNQLAPLPLPPSHSYSPERIPSKLTYIRRSLFTDSKEISDTREESCTWKPPALGKRLFKKPLDLPNLFSSLSLSSPFFL